MIFIRIRFSPATSFSSVLSVAGITPRSAFFSNWSLPLSHSLMPSSLPSMAGNVLAVGEVIVRNR